MFEFRSDFKALLLKSKNVPNLYNNCLVAKLGTASTGNFLSGKAETPNLLNF
jgi:hypothetical protein